MNQIELETIQNYITEENKCGEGKEVDVYFFEDKVIKLFRENRTSPFPRISTKGIVAFSKLPLKHFQQPIDLIIKDGKTIGFTEGIIQKEEVQLDSIDFEGIKEDITVLSENGFRIQDIYYNYAFQNQALLFYDFTSYSYIDTKEPFLQQLFYQKNIEAMNTFLIGLLHFDAFKEDAKAEYTKIYQANEYRKEHCENEFYGDTIGNKKRS